MHGCENNGASTRFTASTTARWRKCSISTIASVEVDGKLRSHNDSSVGPVCLYMDLEGEKLKLPTSEKGHFLGANHLHPFIYPSK